MITIVGLGPGSRNALTVGVLEVLKSEERVFFRTEKHPNVPYLRELGIKFETYDNYYEKFNNFDEIYAEIASDLVRIHEQHGNLVYAVPGHPLVAEKSVTNLINLCRDREIEVKLMPSVSFVDAVIESLKLDPIEGLKIVDAFDIKNQVMDKRVGVLITQVYNRFIASETKLALCEYYKDDTEIYFVRAAGVEGQESIRKIKLFDLDRQDDIDYLTSIYIPKKTDEVKDFKDLLDVMKTLRGENGCMWDLEQTHESLKRDLIEECYEVIEAIDEKDDSMMIEELGDLLFQVVFHSQLGSEEGYYNINDIIEGITNKMILRHPHIFGDVKVDSTEEILDNWDQIKAKEHKIESYTDELKHVPRCMPGLIRADKVQKKAAKYGFDWDSVEPAMDKVLEELQEVKDVYKTSDVSKIQEEVGDLIFATVNIARFLDIDPEFAVNYTIDKFIKRFQFMEESGIRNNQDLKDMSLEEMEFLWNKAKKNEK